MGTQAGYSRCHAIVVASGHGHALQQDLEISGIHVAPGETREIYLKVSESYLASAIQIPVTVIRGRKPGPTAYVLAALHGDEINGVDIVRRLIFDIDHENLSGTLIAVPVVNIPGFLTQTRYLPYHRDLNRFFPGDRKGNNADRFAARLFNEIIRKCDFGIDLHTAAEGRLNLPHVRGDMSNPKVRKLARAFGATVLVSQSGVRGSLRREATEAGVPTILFEAGETGRFSAESLDGWPQGRAQCAQRNGDVAQTLAAPAAVSGHRQGKRLGAYGEGRNPGSADPPGRPHL